MTIKYLLISNITKDLNPGGSMPGGTALYSALAAQRLGWRVGLVTYAPDPAYLRRLLPDVELHILPIEQACTFEHHYRGNHRQQVLHYVVPPLTFDDVPVAWRDAPIVHLGPAALDVDYGLISRFPNSLMCATAQGWIRKWDEEGLITYTPLEDPASLFRPIDVLVFSTEDVNHDPNAINQLIRSVPIAVVTEDKDGAVVHTKDGARSMPGRPANLVDPTGAGDVFAAAYFIRFHETGDPYQAAAFANMMASFSIEHKGTQGCPTRAQVEAWLAEHT